MPPPLYPPPSAPPPSPPPSPIPPGYDVVDVVGFQAVSSDPCLPDEASKEAKCNQIIAQVAADVQVEESRVQCLITCGSLILDIYIEVRTDNPTTLQTSVNTAYPALADLQTAFDVTVIRQTMAYQTTIPSARPPSSPPSPPPQCSTTCDFFLDGASLTTTDYSFMCMKYEGQGTTCKPMYNGAGCPSDMDICDMPHTPAGTVAPGTGQAACQDTPGKWAAKKCFKKVRKNKCHKRKVQRNCKASCGMC